MLVHIIGTAMNIIGIDIIVMDVYFEGGFVRKLRFDMFNFNFNF